MKKILIIDDSETFVKILSDYLPEDRYMVLSAENGKVGLQKIKEEKPDLIILDMLMPEMGGWDFLQEINKEDGESRTPILIASQTSEMDKVSKEIELSVQAGVKGYIVKADESLESILRKIDKTFEEEEKGE
ncbi:hypothetical protein A2442_00365 [Candidatus Campbellbacteria bacterium RIFOXYC2_FULL_35_25]|uniref:Response regulatory domain-containing protein n=1 Tax=Candidatus Campbellbacteria bacterium RIFOXYC2_FULL_35_25 TaxID=1797582 RepID=A0A1F5EI62_9BACT|nr:MAG: hypothetical protein A2442_00365 [Candidatus Campbellbacteria bacterium RIFOXYC2_FULL_35_25]